MAFRERGCVCGFFGSDVDRSGTTTYMGDKAGGWLDHTRRARRNEDRAFVQSGEDAIQVERHFAKPADVRSNPTAALALSRDLTSPSPLASPQYLLSLD